MASPTLKDKIKKLLQLDLNKKNYISEIDLFIANFNQTHPELSESQQKEKAKFDNIAASRDTPQKESEKSKIWKDF